MKAHKKSTAGNGCRPSLRKLITPISIRAGAYGLMQLRCLLNNWAEGLDLDFNIAITFYSSTSCLESRLSLDQDDVF